MANDYNVETDIINVNERKLDELKKDYNNFKKQMINLDNQNNLVSSVNRFRLRTFNTIELALEE